MPNFLETLLSGTPEGKLELIRAELRVSVAEALQAEMAKAKISKAALAKKIGVSRARITQALTTNRNMTLNTLADISYALGLTPTVQFATVQAMRAPAVASVPAAPASRGEASQPIATLTGTSFASTGVYTGITLGQVVVGNAQKYVMGSYEPAADLAGVGAAYYSPIAVSGDRCNA